MPLGTAGVPIATAGAAAVPAPTATTADATAAAATAAAASALLAQTSHSAQWVPPPPPPLQATTTQGMLLWLRSIHPYNRKLVGIPAERHTDCRRVQLLLSNSGACAPLAALQATRLLRLLLAALPQNFCYTTANHLYALIGDTPTCWNSCETTDWKRSTTNGLGGGGPWLHTTGACWDLELTSILQPTQERQAAAACHRCAPWSYCCRDPRDLGGWDPEG